MAVTWTADQLDQIGEAEELHIAVNRADGTPQPELPIWVVRVDQQVYVRTWYRRNTGWFGHALTSRQAWIRAPGLEIPVVIDDVHDHEPELRAHVDAAYAEKYRRYGAPTVDRMLSDEAAATTLRLIPEQETTTQDVNHRPAARMA